MDGNKDDALKCLKIGKEAMEAGDRARALKFFIKAQRLDPHLPVDDLLSALEKDSEDQAAQNPSDSGKEASGSPESKPSDHPSLRKRGSSSVGSSASTPSSSTASYTEEQIAIVRQIKKKKDYYEILGLEKSCSVEDVRKAYRKLSLKVHPDKNNAPGAEEAFKSVSKAFQCLSNEESRKKYDISGSDEPVYERRPATRNGFNGYYEAEFDADEIFRNFFFGGMPPATTQFRTFNFGTGMGHRTGDHGSAHGFNLRSLIQLLPVLLILLLNFLPSSEPIYSLSRSYPYEYKITTQKGVNYYVKSAKFEQDYPPNTLDRARIEERVENDYFSVLTQNCRFELQRQQWGFIRETPHCDMLRQFKAAAAS
ncbi:chaperone protein dnaJ 49-like [Carica papaya]|uniref:chaperone protein dnaJ 49-like n=1 Tax=Carica papaya TaxID=3649 RepID=UPI000B8CB8B0|nr:chaperone protein dnaJ 49-like [Carica papaya]XP_021895212.1 chaperone protein dnaJ 49-like [Carica papaya]XP_021895213.1 chaperone protein dnaJ 49-like [Carica papaya]XP_021895214.1 chaperone protein dnaJ 49-like [Carica papaya]